MRSNFHFCKGKNELKRHLPTQIAYNRLTYNHNTILNPQVLHPVLEQKSNCEILARNLGVRALSTFVIAFCGIKNMHLYKDLVFDFLKGSNATKASAFEDRLFKYHPCGHRCALLFCSYQVINLVGSYLHKEELIHLIHHFVSIIISWLCMHPGCSQFYVLAGSVTEVPAFFSSLYVSFDHGDLRGFVPGLGKAFPRVRIMLSLGTAITFIFFRALFFSFICRHYLKDVSRAMQSSRETCQSWKKFLSIHRFCVCAIMLIQIFLFSYLLRYIPVVIATISDSETFM